MHLCRGFGLLSVTDPKEHERQLKRKQRNRAAAQRSRQKRTDKADALHQQHELLEKHNHALQKEIRALQAELARWSRTLHMHERLCAMAPASCSAPGPAGGWPGLHRCVEPLSLFQAPASPRNQQPSPCPQRPASPGILPCPLPSLPLGPTAVTASSTHPCPSPVMSPRSTGSSLLGTSSGLSALLPSPPQLAPPQPLRPEDFVVGKLGPSASLGLARLQSREQKAAPAFSGADGQGPWAAPSPRSLLAFPLLSSAQAGF